jgi:hypothetical protein
MVDYNSQHTISTPPGDVLKIAILERRHYVIGAIQSMFRMEFRGAQGETYEVRSGLYALFLEIEPALIADMGEEEVKKLRDLVNSTDDDSKKPLEAFKIINNWLYKKNLTKFDTRKSVDTTDIEAVNRQNGF